MAHILQRQGWRLFSALRPGLETRMEVPGNLLVASRPLNVSRACLATEQDLEKAKQAVTQLREDPGNDIKLELYGLYKQVGGLRRLTHDHLE